MACKPYRWKPEQKVEFERVVRTSGTRAEASEALGISLASFDHACRMYGIDARETLGRGEEIEVSAPPPSGLSKDELVADMKRRFERRNAHEAGKKLTPVTVKGDLPIGVFCPGDLHLDDSGTNIALVEEHATICRETPGMYGLCPGDLLNLWIGRLARLYAHQSVTSTEGWQLVEWYVEEVRDWLAIVLGNHDVWAGDGSPMSWISRNAGLFSQAHDVRMALRFSNRREVRIHCRHDFPGNSIYNDSHGLVRAALFGHRDHVKLAGHKHVSSYQIVPDPDAGMAMHMVRVAGYKQHDEFATERGYLKRSLGPACVLVVDPRLPDDHPDLVKPFWDPREGADFLAYARRRRNPERKRAA